MDIRDVPSVDIERSAQLVVVGDVHGCSKELDRLLSAVNFIQGRDVLLLLGDLVNKGNDSEGVVRRAMSIPNCYAIRGNHDVALLDAIDALQSGEIEKRDDPLVQLARTFPAECAEYLRRLPHIYRIPQFNLIAVHAGLNPALSVDAQNPCEVLNMRYITREGVVEDKPGKCSTRWAELWKGPETVIFGHDALAGLQFQPFAIGLDTGCCYGNKLSAVVYPQKLLVQVDSGVGKGSPLSDTQLSYTVLSISEAAAREAGKAQTCLKGLYCDRFVVAKCGFGHSHWHVYLYKRWKAHKKAAKGQGRRCDEGEACPRLNSYTGCYLLHTAEEEAAADAMLAENSPMFAAFFQKWKHVFENPENHFDAIDARRASVAGAGNEHRAQAADWGMPGSFQKRTH